MTNKAPETPETETVEKKSKMPQQNGITHPKEGTQSGDIWAACDEMYKDGEGGNPTFSSIRALFKTAEEDPDVAADSTFRTQIQRWRQFHGLHTPRAAKPAEETQEAEAA